MKNKKRLRLYFAYKCIPYCFDVLEYISPQLIYIVRLSILIFVLKQLPCMYFERHGLFIIQFVEN